MSYVAILEQPTQPTFLYEIKYSFAKILSTLDKYHHHPYELLFGILPFYKQDFFYER